MHKVAAGIPILTPRMSFEAGLASQHQRDHCMNEELTDITPYGSRIIDVSNPNQRVNE